MAETYRFYGELAEWWPLISPPEEYVEEAAFAGELLASASIPVRTVLELGSGGGSNAVHLTPSFTLTLVDLSADMLAVSRRLNPTCEHLVGDMRTVRLDRQFDAVFLHDAVDYMTTEDDLGLAIETAFVHCRPGGVAVITPDEVVGAFEPDTSHGGRDGPDGRSVRYLEWSRDPDPDDTWVETDYAFVLRVYDDVRVVHETHRTGLFRVEDWLRLLNNVGFRPMVVMEATSEDRTPRTCFVAHRPLEM
ncbi:MAG: class I SAM-dependent methyltransferase [Ilumatobacteraceae bacterium]